MLRTAIMIGGSITTNSLGVLRILPNSVCVQCVRWRRKPRWLPVAKSKVFRIPERPKIPEDELMEIKRLSNNYRTTVRSLRRHIIESIAGRAAKINTVLRGTAEKEDFEHCLALNEEWNKSVAKSREIRLAKEREARKEQILQKVMMKEERDVEIIKKIEEKVKEAKKDSLTFITEKNLDQAIEHALANPVDHNWAIDETGTIHHGKYVPPETGNNKVQKRAQQNH